MPISKMTTRYRSVLRAISRHPSSLLLGSVSMSGLALTLFAVLAGALSAWRFGMGLGWRSYFFYRRGLCSRIACCGSRSNRCRRHPPSS